MDIKTFVSESLSQIIAGVEEAQEKNSNSIINAKSRFKYDEQMALANKTKLSPCVIEFDIAVTVEKETGTKGGLAVLAGAFTLGSSGQSKASDTVASRVKFSVPVNFQYSGKPIKETKPN